MSISTEGRVFVAQMIRDVRRREKVGAGLLSPGATNWKEALTGFGHEMAKCKGGSPRTAAKTFSAAHARLKIAQQEHSACFLNFYHRGNRSGMFELLTYEVAKHPLTNEGYEGVEMCSYLYRLQRIGVISMYGKRAAYISWHALARLHERSRIDIFSANGIVGLIGITGIILRESEKHFYTGVNLTFSGPFICAGVLRGKNIRQMFFDCITVLENADHPKYAQQLEQGRIVAAAAVHYMGNKDVDPRPYQKVIPVVPFNREDYITQTLKKRDTYNKGMEVLK